MNTTFNSALKQSSTIRKELSALANPSYSDASSTPPPALTPAALGSLSASLTSFARTLDEYNQLAKQELNPAKQEKAHERIAGFRTELQEYRTQVAGLKAARDDAVQTQSRAELLGRRPFVSSTPENPYANAAAAGGAGSPGYGIPGASGQPGGGGGGGGGGYGVSSGGVEAVSQEAYRLRETHSALDEYISRGREVLGDLGSQRETLKNSQKRLYSVANTLGLSGQTIRMVERRARQDKLIFGIGVVAFFGFCWLVLHYLR
ncbi:V-snare-domain-containing protein [Phialemonium atrogriseum]|uniref:Protein transport protein BOS1 n=1 Tax=Phialemonium atrogriseum TaxID=1093897 RepID=A0AAJ0BWZ7_9PEZI|nr:V-snare-domain-containing protein [Phialemonium atrogriseum]KAK1765835.1 V-snare-domain-containing protein [Phialemonium atrogriseum]